MTEVDHIYKWIEKTSAEVYLLSNMYGGEFFIRIMN